MSFFDIGSRPLALQQTSPFALVWLRKPPGKPDASVPGWVVVGRFLKQVLTCTNFFVYLCTKPIVLIQTSASCPTLPMPS